MKLIINIDKQDFTTIRENGFNGYADQHNRIVDAIANGTPLKQIKVEIEKLHYHPKLDFIKNDEVVDMALDIIDKYKTESEDKRCQ